MHAWLSDAWLGARRNGDIQDGWLNIMQGLSAAMAIPHLETFSGPGGWNDMVRIRTLYRPWSTIHVWSTICLVASMVAHATLTKTLTFLC